MSKNRKSTEFYGKENNTLKTVLYILLIAALVICIVGLKLMSNKRHTAFNEAKLAAAENETEFKYPVIEKETEKETETETLKTTEPETQKEKMTEISKTQTSSKQETTDTEKETESLTKNERETAKKKETETETEGITEEESESQKETETESQTETESERQKKITENLSILILNGTRRPGIAGLWNGILTKAGYKNISVASYTGEDVGQNTIIYCNKEEIGKELLDMFADAELKTGRPGATIEPSDGVILPDRIDAYVLVGMNDADIETLKTMQ